MIRYYLIVALWLGFVVSAYSQSEYAEERADAVYQSVLHEYVMNDDQSLTYNYEHRLLLKTSFAFTRQYGESFIVYNPRQQKLKIRESETIMADGKKVPAPVNAFNEVLPQFANQAAPYMHLREMVVTHTGIEKNALIHFAYTLDTKKGYYPGLTGKVIFGDRSPIKELTVKVIVPNAYSLKYTVMNGDIKPSVQKSGGKTIYTWIMKNIPLVENEAGQPAFEEFIPTLYFSTSDIKTNYRHMIPDEKTIYAIPDVLKEQVKALIKEKTGLNDQLITIKDFVEKTVGTMPADHYYLGYKAMPAATTFKNNVGSPLDKAVLLTAIYRSLGMEAYPVLVSAHQKAVDDFSYLAQYNSVMVRVKGYDGYIDPCHAQTTGIPAVINGHTYCILKDKPSGGVIAFRGEKENTISMDAQVTVDAHMKLSGKAALTMDGLLKYDINPAGISTLLKTALASTCMEMKIDETKAVMEKDNPGQWTAAVSGSVKQDASGMFMLLDLPKGIMEPFHIPLNSTTRTTPIQLAHPVSERYSWIIHLPEGYVCRQSPVDINIQNAVGMVQIKTVFESGKLLITRKTILNKDIISAQDYDKLAEILRAWRNPQALTFYLEK